jgi:plasmid stabilization system protein ParE
MDKITFRYRFSETALEEIHEIFNYISFELSSPKAADDLIHNIEKHVNMICAFPYAYNLVENVALRELGYRKTAVKNFSLFYVIEDDLIIIEHILNSRRDFEHWLKK